MGRTTFGSAEAEALVARARAVLREQRIRARRSQHDVALAVSSSRKRVSDFELGLADPGFGFVVALAMELGVTLSISGPCDPFERAEPIFVDNNP